MVTKAVCGTGPDDNGQYSKTHCCLPCERGEGCHLEGDWLTCAGIPGANFKEIALPECETKAHSIIHIPEGNGPFPVMLFLHGALTFVYPEHLWQDIRDLIDKNEVVRARFIVIAPFATVGEPVAVVSEWNKKNRYGVAEPYVKEFNAKVTWSLFIEVCKSLGTKVDWARLSALGYSMGAQCSWDLLMRHSAQLAAVVPFAASCTWETFDWDASDQVQNDISAVAIRSYNGEQDWRTYSWKDFEWLAHAKGLDAGPKETSESLENPVKPDWSRAEKVEVTHHTWSDSLQLSLLRGTDTAHVCWHPVFFNEGTFKLFTWLERRSSTDQPEKRRRLDESHVN